MTFQPQQFINAILPVYSADHLEAAINAVESLGYTHYSPADYTVGATFVLTTVLGNYGVYSHSHADTADNYAKGGMELQYFNRPRRFVNYHQEIREVDVPYFAGKSPQVVVPVETSAQAELVYRVASAAGYATSPTDFKTVRAFSLENAFVGSDDCWPWHNTPVQSIRDQIAGYHEVVRPYELQEYLRQWNITESLDNQARMMVKRVHRGVYTPGTPPQKPVELPQIRWVRPKAENTLVQKVLRGCAIGAQKVLNIFNFLRGQK